MFFLPIRSFVSSGPWTAALTVAGRSLGSEKHWLSFKSTFSFSARSLTLHCYSVSASTWAVKEFGSHFVFSVCVYVCLCVSDADCRGSWKCMQLWRELERRRVSLSAPLLSPLSCPLRLAQRLTLSTLLSLLTLLHKEPCCWPQQYSDMPLRWLINSSGCANGV